MPFVQSKAESNCLSVAKQMLILQNLVSMLLETGEAEIWNLWNKTGRGSVVWPVSPQVSYALLCPVWSPLPSPMGQELVS